MSQPQSDRVLLLRPDWPVPARVRGAVSLRGGGVSAPPYASLNLALHVGDDSDAVRENRGRLRAALALPAEPLWLTQVHGARVLQGAHAPRGEAGQAFVPRDEPTRKPAPAPAAALAPHADAAVTREAGCVLAVLVADCLPVLFARADGNAVAVAHAGWRGLAAGVLEATVGALGGAPGELHAWLGPAIGAAHFEVGTEVRTALCAHAPQAAAAFERNARARWQCDLHRLVQQRLAALGLGSVHGEPRCTYAQSESFFSYRRDGVTGRMAALIWLAP